MSINLLGYRDQRSQSRQTLGCLCPFSGLLSKQEIVLEIQKELGDRVQLDDTGAGRQLNEEINQLQEKHTQEFAQFEEEKQEALRRGFGENSRGARAAASRSRTAKCGL